MIKKMLEDIRFHKENAKELNVKNDDLIPVSLQTAKYISLEKAIEAIEKLDKIVEIIKNIDKYNRYNTEKDPVNISLEALNKIKFILEEKE